LANLNPIFWLSSDFFGIGFLKNKSDLKKKSDFSKINPILKKKSDFWLWPKNRVKNKPQNRFKFNTPALPRA